MWKINATFLSNSSFLKFRAKNWVVICVKIAAIIFKKISAIFFDNFFEISRQKLDYNFATIVVENKISLYILSGRKLIKNVKNV